MPLKNNFVVPFATDHNTSTISNLFISKNYVNVFHKNLQNLRHENRFCDVEIFVNNNEKSIQAHRIVLSASSSYFEAMFRHLNSENYMHKITLHSITYEILELLLDFIYTGQVEINQVR